jgi:hypothetical protein
LLVAGKAYIDIVLAGAFFCINFVIVHASLGEYGAPDMVGWWDISSTVKEYIFIPNGELTKGLDKKTKIKL